MPPNPTRKKKPNEKKIKTKEKNPVIFSVFILLLFVVIFLCLRSIRFVVFVCLFVCLYVYFFSSFFAENCFYFCDTVVSVSDRVVGDPWLKKF